jgi:hypothetical protein
MKTILKPWKERLDAFKSNVQGRSVKRGGVTSVLPKSQEGDVPSMAGYVAKRDETELDDPELDRSEREDPPPGRRRRGSGGPSRGADRKQGEAKGDGGGPLERVTVNLNLKASQALDMIVKLTGGSKTDAINRALQFYAFFEETTNTGGSFYLREEKDGPFQLLKVF